MGPSASRGAAAPGAARAPRGDGRCRPGGGRRGRRADAERARARSAGRPAGGRGQRRAGRRDPRHGAGGGRRRRAGRRCSPSRRPPAGRRSTNRKPRKSAVCWTASRGRPNSTSHRASISSSFSSRCRRRWPASAPSTRSARRWCTSCAAIVEYGACRFYTLAPDGDTLLPIVQVGLGGRVRRRPARGSDRPRRRGHHRPGVRRRRGHPVRRRRRRALGGRRPGRSGGRGVDAGRAADDRGGRDRRGGRCRRWASGSSPTTTSRC